MDQRHRGFLAWHTLIGWLGKVAWAMGNEGADSSHKGTARYYVSVELNKLT